MSASPLSRERVETAGPNVELKLKNCSLELDKVRTAARRYLTALGSALNDDASSSRLSAAENRSSPISIARPQTVTDYSNKTSSSFERVNINSHRKYLSSPNDSGWVAQCLNGGKCVNRTPTEGTRRKNQDPEQIALGNSRVFTNINQDTPKPNVVRMETISPFKLIDNYNVSGTNNRSIAAPAIVETASNSGEQLLLQKMTEGKGLYESPVDQRVSKKPNEKDNRLVLPISMEGDFKGEVFVDDSEDEQKSVASMDGVKKGSLHPEILIDSTSESTSTPEAQILPQNTTGEKGLPILPISTAELLNDFEQQNSLTRSWIRPEISAVNVEKASQRSTGDESLPISIQLKPVIHNHYYNRRQTKSTKGPDESSSSDFDFRPMESIVELRPVVNGTNKTDTDGKIKSPKSGGRYCDDLKSSGCGNWASAENLMAAGDLVKRMSTGKRQSGGDTIDGANSESAMKTEVQNTKYPEEPGTLFPKNKNGNSNIFLFMGGQWLVNVKDHPEILHNMKPKSSEPFQNMMGLHGPPPSTNYGRLSWPYNPIGAGTRGLEGPYSKQVPSSAYPTLTGILPSYQYVPCYSNRNGIPASRSSEKISTRDYSNFPSGDNSQGEFQAPYREGSYYYPINPPPIFPLPVKPRLSYPESLVNFPLGDIKQNQGANMGFPQSPVKPEEHMLHDVDSSDLTVIGAQMLSILQPPRPNLPDPKYPLQPVAINDMSSSQVVFPSARDSSVYPNKPLTMYNYHQLQQIPSIYNTSHSSASHQVYLPPKILINDRNPPISHPGFDEYDFVSGQYVKRYRSGTASDSGYYGRTAGNSPVGNAWGCREQNQRYPRNPEDTFHHYRHSWDYLPWGTYKLERVHDEYPTERNNPSERNQNPIANS